MGSNRMAKQRGKRRRLWKFRRAAEPAVTRVEGLHHQIDERCAGLRCHIVELRNGIGRIASRLCSRRFSYRVFERPHDRFALLDQLAALRFPQLADAREQLIEARASIARKLRKISAAVKRLAIRRQEHRQRPATSAARDQLVRGLVDLVDIRAFFAIDLDVDEVRVHQRRGVFIFEAFVRHHVTPVTGRIADRQQDGPVAFARGAQRFFAPRIPVDRIFGVLLEIGARFVGESVWHGAGRTCHSSSLSPPVSSAGISFRLLSASSRSFAASLK